MLVPILFNILGRDSSRVHEHGRIDVHKLNNHYAVISTDNNYTEPRAKLAAVIPEILSQKWKYSTC